MKLARLWRTVKHLSSEQFLYFFICGGKNFLMGFFPSLMEKYIMRLAFRLPNPETTGPPLVKMANTVLMLQRAVYGDSPANIRTAKFTLLNQTFNFGAVEKISWRGDFLEGDNPLRRMNLAYMGYIVPLLANGQSGDIKIVCQLIQGLEDQNSWSISGVFRDVWNPYTVSHRLVNLLCGLAVFQKAGGKPDPISKNKILEHIRFCTAFVNFNLERHLQYNHLFKNYVALTVFASATNNRTFRFKFLEKAIQKAIQQTILPDGGHVERSPMYHLLAVMDLDILKASDFFSKDFSCLLEKTQKKMVSALYAISHPDGEIALFNDSWLGETPSVLKFLKPNSFPDTLRLNDTGYVRIGKKDEAVLFDCGPCGPNQNPAHGHADFLSVEISVAGHRLVVDPGVPTYTSGRLRDTSRSAERHNGPYLMGVEPVEFWKSFRVGKRANATEIRPKALSKIAPLWCAGCQNGYANLGVETQRFVGLWPGEGLLICDLIFGETEYNAQASFLIEEDWKLVNDSETTFIRDQKSVFAKAMIGDLGKIDKGSYWPRFGLETHGHTLTVSFERQRNKQMAAVILGWKDTFIPPSQELVNKVFENLITNS